MDRVFDISQNVLEAAKVLKEIKYTTAILWLTETSVVLIHNLIEVVGGKGKC